MIERLGKGMDNNKKAIGYIRVSSDEQAREGLSLEAQTKKIQAYCEFAGLELVAIIKDEAVSGFKTLEKRPGGKELLQALKGKQAFNIISVKLDRLFRNTADAIIKSQDFQKAGVDLHLLDVKVDTSTATGKMFFTVLAMLAQFERDVTGERTKTVLDMKRRDGKVYNHEPYGYNRNQDILEPNAHEIEGLEYMKLLKSQGYSLRNIGLSLENAGFMPKKTQHWTAQTVKQCLKQVAA